MFILTPIAMEKVGGVGKRGQDYETRKVLPLKLRTRRDSSTTITISILLEVLK